MKIYTSQISMDASAEHKDVTGRFTQTVHSSGSVQLEDGRDLTFSLDLSMERESLATESLAWRAAADVLMDPLVFHFDCDLESLANRSFQFDLDSDGVNELSEAQVFLRQMAALRQAQVRSMTMLRSARRHREDKPDLLASLFPEWKRESGLESVIARRERNALS